MVEIRRYVEAFRAVWERLVDESINGTFLHKRSFIDYHGERFEDFSLLAMVDEKLVAVFPAETENGMVFSHRGLSYGGWVFGKEIKEELVRLVILAGFRFLHKAGIEHLHIRSIPAFYHTDHYLPAQEAYRQFGSVKTTKTFQTILPPFSWKDKGRRWGYKKALKAGLQVSADSRLLEEFWDKVFVPNLWQRHRAKPVHSLAEIQLLFERFPNAIKLYSAVLEGEVLAGVLVFKTDRVIHTQYIANGPKGRELRALDFLMHDLLMEAYAATHFFSLGISNEPSTGVINRGLYDWKRSLGAVDFMESDFDFLLGENSLS